MELKKLLPVLVVLASIPVVLAVSDIYTDYNFHQNDIFNATNVNATSFFQGGNAVLDTTDEPNLNVNSSDYWDNYDVATDLNNLITLMEQNITNENWLEDSQEGSLNVNSSDFWDNYNTPSALNYLILLSEANITDENWLEDSQEGNLNVNSSGFWDNLDTVSDISGLVDSQISDDLTTNLTKAIGNLNSSLLINLAYLNYKISLSENNITDENWLEDSQEGNLNVNSSDYWDNLNVPSDLNYLILLSQANITDEDWIEDAQEGNLDVNSSDYWDNLGVPSDLDYLITLSQANISDEDWIEDAQEGNLNVNSSDYWDNLGIPSDLNYLVNLSYHNITDIPTCSGTNKLFFNGSELTCETDETIGNCSADQSCANVLYTSDEYLGGLSCSDTQIAKYNSTSGNWECEIDQGAGGDISAVYGDGVYVYNGSSSGNVNLAFNETRLNGTIDSRDNYEADTDTNASTACTGLDYLAGDGTCNADSDTQLSTEQVQDYIYNNVLSGVQTRIAVTYDDVNSEVDYVVDDMVEYNTTEDMQDATGVMAGSYLTYDDAGASLDVSDNWVDETGDEMSETLNFTDQADDQATEVQTGDKHCLDGSTCSHYITYNGTAVIIE